MFIYDYLNSEGPFFDRIKQLNSGEVVSKNIDGARDYIKKSREELIRLTYAPPIEKERTFLKKIKYELSPYVNILRWYLYRPKNPWAVVGPVTGISPARIILRDHYAHKRYKKFADKFQLLPVGESW